MPTVTRAVLTDAVHEEIGLPRREAAEFVDAFIEIICKRLEAGETVKISGFGSFMLRDKAPRTGRNPKTGETAPISARCLVMFRASHVLKQRIDEGMGGGNA